MERRKITTLGKYSLVVTLPKNWTSMNNIKGGDEVTLKIQGDGSLVIHPEYDFDSKQNEVSLQILADEDAKMIQRKIISCYLNGYDKIELVSEKNFTREQQQAIRAIVKSLYMRIYESQSDRAILQAFMDESLASVTSGLERMHIITSSMAKDVLTAIREWDVELARSVISLEEDVDQFMFFLTRLLRTAVNNPSLATKLQISMSDTFDYHLLVNRIEYIADYLTSISETLVELSEYRDKVSPEFIDELLKVAERAFGYYDRAVDAFFDDSIKDIGTIIDESKHTQELKSRLGELPNKDEDEKKIVMLCTSLVDYVRRVGYSTADIAELTLDRHFTPS